MADPRGPYQNPEPPLENPAGRSSPPGMYKGNPFTWNQKIDRDAVCDRHGEQRAGGSGDPTVYTLDVGPASCTVEGHHFDPVHLIPQSDSRELRHLLPECKPSAHHLTHRLLAPETKIEPGARL